MKKIVLFAVLASIAVGSVAQATIDTLMHQYEQLIPGTNVKFSMVPVTGGTFLMGSDEKEKVKEKDEQPQHQITISPFWMGAYEVTYDEYNLFFLDASLSQNIPTDAVTRPSSPYIDLTLGMGKDGGFPANSMQQHGALMYCKWLYNKTGIFYRLPTEAEWEYACRAGSSTAYPFGDNASSLEDYA